MTNTLTPAPKLMVSEWLNTQNPITLELLIGKVVVIEAFQMLCPGCVSHGLPQAKRISETFSGAGTNDDVVVLGLHCVFEHHKAQGTKAALEAFIHEYRIEFPVGIDAHANNTPIPQTMLNYQLNGTPSLIIIDRNGALRHQFFGSVSDMTLGAAIMELILEKSTVALVQQAESGTTNCDSEGCKIEATD